MNEEMRSTLQMFDTLDELSRHRALNLQESLTLEFAQRRLLSSSYAIRAELRKRGIRP